MKGEYIYFHINESNNNINIFFSKENYNLVGWQVEDIYQNLAVTYIFNTSINSKIDEKLFKLPKTNVTTPPGKVGHRQFWLACLCLCLLGL